MQTALKGCATRSGSPEGLRYVCKQARQGRSQRGATCGRSGLEWMERGCGLHAASIGCSPRRWLLRGLLGLGEQRGEDLRVAIVCGRVRLHVVVFGQLLRLPVAVEHRALAADFALVERRVLFALG